MILFPYWIQDGGPYQLLERLADPSLRDRLRDEVGPGPDATWDEMWMTNFTVSKNRSLSGLTVARAAGLRSQHPVDMLCDLLVEEKLRVSFSYMNADVRNLPRYLAHPLAMAASDAVLLGEHPPPRTYATFVSMLSDYSRDEPVMSLTEAIRKMTSMPAQRIGLPDRGILRDGFKADLVVFDPEHAGLKTSSANPQRRPHGIPHVIVNGVHTVDEGKRTSATPGRALKRFSHAGS